MGQTVLTAKGEIDIDELEITDHVEIGDNYRKVATEYRHHGELVKRTVSVDGLRMPGSASSQGKLS
jgi:hypothetical protein